MIVTKLDVKEFIESFGDLYKIEDKFLGGALSILCSHISDFILYGKPDSHVLTDWEYSECFRMKDKSNMYDKYVFDPICLDLEPYYISYQREKKLKKLL